jgi:hypothetical protein
MLCSSHFLFLPSLNFSLIFPPPNSFQHSSSLQLLHHPEHHHELVSSCGLYRAGLLLVLHAVQLPTSHADVVHQLHIHHSGGHADYPVLPAQLILRVYDDDHLSPLVLHVHPLLHHPLHVHYFLVM